MSKKKDKTKKTYVAIVLDKSGSMASTKEQTIQGYNEQVQQIRKNAKDQEVFVSLVTFNSDVIEHLWNEPADKLQEANPADYVPDGTTAMRDAIGYTVQKLTKTAEKDANVAFLVIIISDGEENASQHISKSVLKELIDGRQSQGNWTFTYMGCSEEVVRKVAQETSIPIANMAVWENRTAKGTRRAMKRTGENVANYLNARVIRGASATSNFHSTEDLCCANYTSEPGDASVAPPTIPTFVPPILGGTPAPNFRNILGLQTSLGDVQPIVVNVNNPQSAAGYFSTGNSVKWEG